MFGKMQAISTVKHLSRNYASFQQPSVQEWYSLSTSGQTQSIFKKYRWLSWRWILPAERRYFQRLTNRFESVCDVNSEYRRIQVNSADFKVFLPYTFIIQIHFFYTAVPRSTDWYSWSHFQNDIFINSYRYHYQLIGLQTITKVPDSCQAVFEKI